MESVAKLFSSIVKEIGIAGFLLVFSSSIFIFYATKDQKLYFIDHYILLKNTQHNYFPAVLIVVFVIYVYIITFMYLTNRLKIKNEEIDRLSKERNRLQNLYLDRDLPSSE